MQDKTAGIIGGMGPEATADLLMRVIRATPARDDEDHIRVLVDNNPKVPSRIKALIEGTGESPAPCLMEMARNLERWGADFLAIPCNTAHYYYEEIASAVNIPVLNMIGLTVESVMRDNPGIQCAGLLSSPAVHMTGLYKRPMEALGRDLVYPDESPQNHLMRAIRKIKTGRFGGEERNILQAAAENLERKGAEAIIVACTELSLIADVLNGGKPYGDASQILAESIVRYAKGGAGDRALKHR